VLGLLGLGGPSAVGGPVYTVKDLGTNPVPTTGFVQSQNAAGQQLVDGDQAAGHAIVVSGGTRTVLDSIVGGTSGTAASINDAGDVVGSWSNGSVSHAFLYHGGAMVDIGTLFTDGFGSSAEGVNNSDLVVGESNDNSAVPHAFLYGGGRMVDLNRLIAPAGGWVLSTALGINNGNQILALGTDPQGQNHSLLLSPSSPGAVLNALNTIGTKIQQVTTLPHPPESTTLPPDIQPPTSSNTLPPDIQAQNPTSSTTLPPDIQQQINAGAGSTSTPSLPSPTSPTPSPTNPSTDTTPGPVTAPDTPTVNTPEPLTVSVLVGAAGLLGLRRAARRKRT
jgi:probable HAF family extracellular repeat protein